MKSKLFFQRLNQNWKSGLTVALVSLPLSLALALASGATPTQGILTAFWAGLFAGLFGGSHYNITGPTGALSGILIGYTLIHGPSGLPLIALLSGLMILLAYVLRLDRYIIFIPRSVVLGFTLGVAFIIALGQLNSALGISGLPKKESLLGNIWMSLTHIHQLQVTSFLVFFIAFVFILLWNRRKPKIPGPIFAALGGILFSWLIANFGLNLNLPTLGHLYPDLQATLFQNPWATFSLDLLKSRSLWLVSAATALVAILETLLSGQIADDMTGTKFNRSKEVLGLSLANLASGAMGGIPATAALARTALNIKSQANHQTSAVLNSLFLMIIALIAFPYFKLLPMAVIAAILMVVAVGMVERKHFIFLWNHQKSAFFLSLLVAIITLAEDPMIGILFGTFIALLVFAHNMSYGQTEVLLWKGGKMTESLLKHEFIHRKEIHSDLVVYKISGTLTYINMPAHLEAVQKIRGNKHVILSLRHAFYADSDGAHYLKELVETLKANNEEVMLSGINQEIKKMICDEPFYKKECAAGKVYKRSSEAIYAIYGR